MSAPSRRWTAARRAGRAGRGASRSRRARGRTRDQCDRDDEHVGEEDRTPPEVLQQPAARHATEAGADACERGPIAIAFGDVQPAGTRARAPTGGGHHERGTDTHGSARAINALAELANAAKPTRCRTGSGRRSARAPSVSVHPARRRSAAAPRTRGCTRRRSTAASSTRRRDRGTSVGRATFRLALATTIITRLRQSTASVHHRRSSPGSRSTGAGLLDNHGRENVR